MTTQGLHEATRPYQLGIDVGSTTVKAVVLDGNRRLFSDYRRHNADVRASLGSLLADVERALPGARVHAAITGSGGLTTARAMGIPFVQEVIAGTEATQRLHPEVDVVIELGGEDAKLTYLHPTPEQRMNGTCAGGTGAFIDQMATLLHTDASGLGELATRHTQLYPIASRCGVFAKSDIQPLINQGAAHEDLAASIFNAVATQTIAGLACGRPIRGTVMFLGGLLHFLPALREAYKALLPKADSFVTPDDAQLYVAIGAALLAQKEAAKKARQAEEAGATSVETRGEKLTTLMERLAAAPVQVESPRMDPLFATPEDREEFIARHSLDVIPKASLDEAEGRCWLGIDAGSTTIKAVVIDSQDRIVFTHYASNEGDPVAAAVDIVRAVRGALPEGCEIGRSCATGYGEGLVKSALTMDEGEIETMAHYRAAEFICPGVTSVIDIGGQDMKYLRIRDHAVDSISVNEACSSGCGSFLQTFAQTMGTDVRSFARMAMESSSPVDLGTRCTVFMNSSVKQAQKEGADVRDISAGLSYSVVRNALYKVIKLKEPSDLGERVVVQGGTFLNDSVLRAFELLTGREVVRPDIAGLMGAYGAALTARMHDTGEGTSSLATIEALEGFSVDTTRKTCRLCQNHCQMTISTFSNGERHVSGNRCERGASLERVPKKSDLPNLYDWKYKRIFGYRRLTEKKAFRGDIGIPRVLGMYENYPFWFTMLTALGFRVMISGRSNHDLFETGMESIPSENVCYPAKLVHGHIESLLDKGITTIFYPCVDFEQKLTESENSFNCPIVATYPEVIRNNMERLLEPGTQFISPFVNFGNREYLPAHLSKTFKEYGYDIPVEEMKAALDKAWEEDAAVKVEIRAKGVETIEWMREHGVRGIVLAGRPYHLDPEINHGIPEVIVGLGMAVLTEDSIVDARLERPLRVLDQWSYHSRLYEAAARVGDEPDLEMVQLNSFGCGVDAITADQVQEILEGRGDVHTVLKIDEVSNLGAAKIRLRSLDAAITERASLASAIDEAGAGDGENGADGAGLAPASSVGLVSGSVDTATLRDPSGDAAREEEAGHIQPPRRLHRGDARGRIRDPRAPDVPDPLPLPHPAVRKCGPEGARPGAHEPHLHGGRPEIRQQRLVLPGDRRHRPAPRRVHLRARRPRPHRRRHHADGRHVPRQQLRGPAAQGPARRRIPAGAGHRPVRPRYRGQPRLPPGDSPHPQGHPGIRHRRRHPVDAAARAPLRGYPRLRDGPVPHVGRLRPGVDHLGTRGVPGRTRLLRKDHPRVRARLRRPAPARHSAQAARRPGRRNPREIPPRRQQSCRRRHRGRGLRGRTARPHAVLPQLRCHRRVGQGEPGYRGQAALHHADCAVGAQEVREARAPRVCGDER